MLSLPTLLSTQKFPDNSNKKFPDSSNKSVFDRLQLNYNFNANDIQLSDSAVSHLNSMPKLLKDWQAEDIRNNNVKDYYHNPVGSQSITIITTCENIKWACTYEEIPEGSTEPVRQVVIELQQIYDLSSTIISLGNSFLTHTDRLSNVVDIDVGEPEDPHYLTCSALGKNILYITHETDGITDNRPILGNFTSLFVGNDLITLADKIKNYPTIISDNMYYYSSPTTTLLSETEISEIYTTLNEIFNLMGGRMEHDKNFWNNCKTINDEFNIFKIMNSMGQSQKTLVDNYIGTEKLKSSLLIDDIPNIIYDVTMDYYGNIQYTPNTSLIDSYNANSPTYIMESYVQYYTTTPLVITPSANVELTLDKGALIFNTKDGLWSNVQSILITNTGNTPYNITSTILSDFTQTEVNCAISLVGNTLGIGNAMFANVSTRGISPKDYTEYGFIRILPDIKIGIKNINDVVEMGVVSPLSITNIYGDIDNKLTINANNGPYYITSEESPSYNKYTWINNSEYPVTISTITNVTDSANLSNMNIYFTNMTLPITLNVGEYVLWTANVKPLVISPNNFTYKVLTSDGQERILKLGVYGGNNGDNGGSPGDGVNDSSLYNETLNTTPEIIIANGTSFNINVYNGKPKTYFTYSGPDLSGSGYLDANGRSIVVNSDGIDSNGYYTYVFTFSGTNRTKTITKAIFK